MGAEGTQACQPAFLQDREVRKLVPIHPELKNTVKVTERVKKLPIQPFAFIFLPVCVISHGFFIQYGNRLTDC